ncbi:MAG: DNA polymerase III subunit alpha [Gammaproteobacteria bacterium]|nr:DNA polymerase III subunit alpha [Gammaproteobacteria bacterium]
MSAGFVHLHVHSEYSLVDSTIRIPEFVAQVRALDMPAVALTEHNNVFSAVKFYKAAEGEGVKPLVGADVWVRHDDDGSRARLVLLCQNLAGYRSLSRLMTRAYREGQIQGVPHVDTAWLDAEALDGLIALSGGIHGDVGLCLLEGQGAKARQRAAFWSELMPTRYYLELTRLGRPGEERQLAAAVELAGRLRLPVVATNDVRFLAESDFEAHEARVCIQEGRALSDPKRPRHYTPAQYLRSPAEMAELFADLPEALANTVHVAERCTLELELGAYHLPIYPVPDGQHVDDIVREEARRGLATRLAAAPPADPAPYHARLELELAVIAKMGFAGYFMIVADFIQWAKAHGIPVGPGRGSGAGSLAAYALGITELDPLAYDLLFERFLNPERVSMPDFDVDFCMDRRDEVIEYVTQRYGRDQVAQIITHGTMAAKAVLRDVGRVLGFPFGFVDQIVKLVPFDPNMTLDRALEEEPQLRQRYQQEEDVRAILDLALSLEGLSRNAGRHAGGVVIAPRPLTEFVPLHCEQGSEAAVTQFDMGDIEAIGLVKFDFLGLRTLTIIDWAVRVIDAELAAAGLSPLLIERLPLDDVKTYQLIQQAQTTAVFQLESRGMKELIKRLKPDRFEDLVALVALFRPGPLQSGMVDDFIERKHGRKFEYMHPSLAGVLEPTYGVILYQEQVMQIAQILAGYSLGAADLLRRAMGKKKAEEMAKQRQSFVEGSVAHGVSEEQAGGIFDLMEKFAGYGFNKSHSAAYALVAYQTAWLKAHYPAAFMSAVLSADMDTTDKVVRLIDECRQLGIAVAPPDVNACAYRFTVADAKSIRYGLGAVKGIGEHAIESLVEARQDGPYRDIFDLCRRNDSKKLNRRVLEALIKAGALDCFGATRRGLMSVVERAMQAADQEAKAIAIGQSDLFGVVASDPDPALSAVDRSAWAEALATEEWMDEELLNCEKETLGLYLSGHPIDRYETELAGLAGARLADLKPGKRRVAGLIVALRFMKSRRGRMAILTLDDKTSRIEATVFNDVLEGALDKLVVDRLVVIDGECSLDEYSGEHALNVQKIWSIDEARKVLARGVVLRVESRTVNGLVGYLRDTLAAYGPGSCPVAVEYAAEQATARVRLADEWRVVACDALLERLRAHLGRDAVLVEY